MTKNQFAKHCAILGLPPSLVDGLWEETLIQAPQPMSVADDVLIVMCLAKTMIEFTERQQAEARLN